MSATIATTVIPAGTWTVDPAHSKVGFAVKHMGIATVRGEFTEFDGTLEIAGDLSSAKAYGTVKAASVDTNEPQRDAHLRSADFFDADSYEDVAFESTRIEAIDEDTYRIVGNLTLHGVTNELVLTAKIQRRRRRRLRQREGRPGDHRPAQPRRLRHEVQPGARQRQHSRRRQDQAHPRHLGRQAGLGPHCTGRRRTGAGPPRPT